MVEGGRIDHAHHAGNAYRALTDTIALAEAVKVAREMTDDEDTLIIVTADHSHTLRSPAIRRAATRSSARPTPGSACWVFRRWRKTRWACPIRRSAT